MKLGTVEAAKIVRDASIEAMDALNSVVVEIAPLLPEADSKDLRLAVARSMSAILDNLVNPALQEYPELEVDEDTWGDIAVSRARARLSAATNPSDE
jgi:DNA-binding transcriptional LysR family regulator